MRNWVIDFDGYAIVPAEDKEQAEMIFLEHITPPADSPILTECHFVHDVSLYEPPARQLSMFDEEYGL